MNTFEKALAAFERSRREGRNMPKMWDEVDWIVKSCSEPERFSRVLGDKLKKEVKGRD
jgi:hypothetical protein